MARSPLFRTVRRLLRRAHAANTLGVPPAELAATSNRAGPSRRDFFLGSIGAAALLPLAAACGDNLKPADDGPGIAVIGGGIAGLTVAHFLRLAGVRADVYEASMRIGGRMYSDRESLAATGQLVELGGELVDSDHLVVQALCTSFGLTLDDLVAETEGLAQDTFMFNDGALPNPSASVKIAEATIIAAFMPVAAKMSAAYAAAEGTDAVSVAEFERIDAMSIPAWLQDEAGLAPSTLIRRILEVSYLEEFGLEVAEQSAWNLLTLIDFSEPDPFRVFGDSDERFHIHEGNDALPTRMAAQLAPDRLHLDHALAKVVKAGDLFELTFTTSQGEHLVTAAHVVYALPFTRLREVDLAGAELSAAKRTVIDELGYGTNAKLMMQFSDRHWEKAPLLSGGGVITDVGDTPDVSGLGSGLQSTWATSRGQLGVEGILTNFVGGDRGLEMGEGTAEAQAQLVLPWLELVFPGITAKYLAGSAIRMHWPSYPHTKGSYSSYRVGQWAFYGTEGTREGNQHFCGEHCSEDYQGYMEGGAETGAMIAAELLDDLDVTYPPALAGILTMLVEARPRACYHAGFGEKMTLRQLRRRRWPELRGTRATGTAR